MKVLLNRKVLTRSAMVAALVKAQGPEQAQTMLAGETCPEFDEARGIDRRHAHRIASWLRARGVEVEVKR